MRIKQFKTRSIKPVLFGSRLKKLRKRRKLNLEDIEQRTKIHSKHLRAIEAGDYYKLPAKVYTLGFIKKYLDCFNQTKVWQSKRLEEFKNEFSAWQQKTQGRLAVHNRLKNPRVIITPKIILTITSLVIVVLVVGYIWGQIRFLATAPVLTIVSPAGKTTIEKDMIEIVGQVNQDATVLINDQSITAARDGTFSQKVKLVEGINNIKIKAQNRFNKQTVKNVQILKSRGEGNTRI